MVTRIREKAGFTLIELLIVVAIIGIIAAIAVPTLISTIGSGKRGRLIANLRTVSSAQAAFFSRYQQYGDFPDLTGSDTTINTEGTPFLDIDWDDGSVGGETYTMTLTDTNGDGRADEFVCEVTFSVNSLEYAVDQTGQITEDGNPLP